MTTATIERPDAGERLKLAAHALLAAHRESVVLRARRALLAALLQRGEATADDVRAAVELPDGIDAKVFGAAPGELARGRIIERSGFAKTNRAAAHARPVSVWRLRDRAAALRWLAMHPEPQPQPANFNNAEPLTLFNMDQNAATGALTPVGQ